MIMPRSSPNDTGIRGVELRNLRLQNVNIETRKISIQKTKSVKGGIRTVILTNDTLKISFEVA
jgi:integrase